jgi:penicillin-binding protein 2
LKIYEDLRGVQSRALIGQYVVLAALGLLLAHFWHLQVVRGREFRERADNNRNRLVPLAAPRGPLLDRSGRVLVENQPSFNVVMTPEHSEDLDRSIALLAQVLGSGEAQIRERLARRSGPYRPVVVKPGASFADVTALQARRLELPEASVEIVPRRAYPLASAAAHSLGRVGEVSDTQLQLPEFAELQPGDQVGQAGVESHYNRQLMGREGYRKVVVNSRGLEVAEAERKEPHDGPSLTLTLDARLQEAMERAFAGRAGSAVALDPETGEILAMTSSPAFDPNRFAGGIEPALWSQLTLDPDTPLVNRVIQGQYAPGSVFKLVMATAALEEGIVTPSTTFYCPGSVMLYGTERHCSRPGGHGMVDLHKALQMSCNVYFYQVGVRLEIERIARYAKLMGLGAPTGVDLPHEAAGLIPSPEWKQRTQKVPWYAGETVSVAIGQGQVLVTPLQVARLAALVANGGRLVQPHLVRVQGDRTVEWPAPVQLALKPETLAFVREGLRAVVGQGGTGWRAAIPGIEICGKTGSAQVVTSERLRRGPSAGILPHAWFLAFAPMDHPRIALAVMVEHGGAGGEAAAPVAREILAAFFARVEDTRQLAAN